MICYRCTHKLVEKEGYFSACVICVPYFQGHELTKLELEDEMFLDAAIILLSDRMRGIRTTEEVVVKG